MKCRAKPFILGIAGGSGSGKSTLARTLAAKLEAGCLTIELDRYYRVLSHLSPADRAAVDFDSLDALDNELLRCHLRGLRQGRRIAVPRYDFTTHTRLSDSDPTDPQPVILLVGILILTDADVRSLLDATVYVDAPPSVCFVRRLERDVRERGRTIDSVVHQYVSSVRPAHQRLVAPSRAHADLTVSGQNLDAGVAQIEELIDRTRRPGSARHRPPNRRSGR